MAILRSLYANLKSVYASLECCCTLMRIIYVSKRLSIVSQDGLGTWVEQSFYGFSSDSQKNLLGDGVKLFDCEKCFIIVISQQNQFPYKWLDLRRSTLNEPLQYFRAEINNKMTKKKSKKLEEQQNFQPRKSKSSNQQPAVPKNRGTSRIQKQKKQPDRIPVYNQMRIQDRRAQQQKYRENFLMKKTQQEKRGFKSLKYENDANSQMAEIDEDSVERRFDNETIKRIKQLLQAQELSLNKQHLHISAENQYAKVQKLTESLSQRHSEYKQLSQHLRLSTQQNHLNPEFNLQMHPLFPQLNKQPYIQQNDSLPKSILEKINQLQQIYY